MKEQTQGRILYKKIRYSKERVILEWFEKIDDQVRYGSADDYNEPMDSFKAALKNLSADCIDLCELTDIDGELQKRIEVHTINIKYETEREIPGINISFKINREKRAGAYSITTPYQILKPKDEDEEVDNELMDKIIKLMQEADYYRTGKKKQLKMDFESDDASAGGAFVVKLNGEQNGLLRPGVLISLTKLANDDTICKQNGKSGIYHINTIMKSDNKESKNDKNVFTFKRNGDILLLTSILNKKIEEYEKDNLNSFVLELIDNNLKLQPND